MDIGCERRVPVAVVVAGTQSSRICLAGSGLCRLTRRPGSVRNECASLQGRDPSETKSIVANLMNVLREIGVPVSVGKGRSSAIPAAWIWVWHRITGAPLLSRLGAQRIAATSGCREQVA